MSLGINNIPPKHCPYSCVYCQLGRTYAMTVSRRSFYAPEELAEAVSLNLEKLASENKKKPDYLTFVPDGEPTLDINLGKTLWLVKKHGIKTAVISNASLINLPEVREDLMSADWISLKVDSVDEDIWRKIDRPHGALKLGDILKGIAAFSAEYKGRLVTETMLADGINDGEKAVSAVADFLSGIKPRVSYILTPTRPPAESFVKKTGEGRLVAAWNIYAAAGLKAEIISGYEGDPLLSAGHTVEDFLEVCSVHPVREDAAVKFMLDGGEDEGALRRLETDGHIVRSLFCGHAFYLRKLGR